MPDDSNINRKEAIVEDGYRHFQKSKEALPQEHVEEIDKAFQRALADPNGAKVIGPDTPKKEIDDLTEKLSAQLHNKGVRLSSLIPEGQNQEIDFEKFARRADQEAIRLRESSAAGKWLFFIAPGLENGVFQWLGRPRVTKEVREDIAYDSLMESMGEENPRLQCHATLRQVALMLGGKFGAKLGLGLGGVPGILLTRRFELETMVFGYFLGTLIGGVFFYYSFRKLVEYLFEKITDSLYRELNSEE